jgi:hypothetical protein
VPLPWFRLDNNFWSNPKILGLIGLPGGYRLVFIWLAAIGYSVAHGTDGYVTPEILPLFRAKPRDLERLVDGRFMWPADGGWVINGWAEFQESSEESQERRRRAQEASRKANCIRWHGPDCGCWRVPTMPVLRSVNGSEPDSESDPQPELRFGSHGRTDGRTD